MMFFSFQEEFYNYAYSNTNIKNATTFYKTDPQMKKKKTKSEAKKRICLFLPGWLPSSKFSLRRILIKHTSPLTQNYYSKYASMFENMSICIMF